VIRARTSHVRDDIVTDLFPDLTPLIDVMFMLIIFLVLTANSAVQYFDVSLPEETLSETTMQNTPDPISITVFPTADQWAINEQKFESFSAFKALLIDQLNTDNASEIVIVSDKSVTVEKLMKLLNLLENQKAPISRFAIEQ
jgi:biopolymer transport protein ExbD